jgi:hypothetical protein
MDDFDDIIRRAPSATPNLKAKTPLWVWLWLCVLSVGVALSLFLGISTSIRSTNNAATIQSNHADIQQLAKSDITLIDNVSTNIEHIRNLREQSGQRYRDAFALIDGNTDRLVKAQGVSAESG